ncbi:MAG: ABC transporter ATP-binding protein [Treponema sp.]|nr:ABC transporter ATP-binding protein [Treponema sp.]
MKSTDALLRIENLSVAYRTESGGRKEHTAGIKNICFSLHAGEVCGIIGESGSGKTTLLSAIMGLLRERAVVRGKILYKQREIANAPEKVLRTIRFKEIGLVFQNHAEYLNPTLSIEVQLSEILKKEIFDTVHRAKRLDELLTAVGLHPAVKKKYPTELSGGMRQRVFIDMALCLQPPLLLIDEPTTALDPESKKHILMLLKTIQRTYHTAMLLVSHDVAVIEALSDTMMVLLDGHLIEKGKTDSILDEPKHPYTFGLLQSSTYLNPWKDLWGIREGESGTYSCPFYTRCTQRSVECVHYTPHIPATCTEGAACVKGGICEILSVKNITKLFHGSAAPVKAVDNCSLRVRHGETVALFGKSGSGKTTLLRIIAGLLKKDAGDIFFLQKKIEKNNLLSLPHALQIVEQDSFSAMNPALSVEQTVAEPYMIIHGNKYAACREIVATYLKKTGLPPDEATLKKKTIFLSGGQRQKTAIARALIVQPKLLLADEITAMLDDSAQVNIMRLLKQLQYEFGFSLLLVTHNSDLVKKTADYVYCIDAGKIIREGSVRKIFGATALDT